MKARFVRRSWRGSNPRRAPPREQGMSALTTRPRSAVAGCQQAKAAMSGTAAGGPKVTPPRPVECAFDRKKCRLLAVLLKKIAVKVLQTLDAEGLHQLLTVAGIKMHFWLTTGSVSIGPFHA